MGPAATDRPRPHGLCLRGGRAVGADLLAPANYRAGAVRLAHHPDLLDADRDDRGVLRGGPERAVPSPQNARPFGAAGTNRPFLPILPPIGCLFIKSYAHAGTWFLGNSGPAFWLLMGLFYGVMAVRKRSLGLAALGVVTGNMGLWVLWHRCGWDFVEFPQLWLIPLALAVLVAEHLDRRRLSEPQRAAIRYLALSVIYVSSTTEFWRHIGQSAVLPLVTILLALWACWPASCCGSDASSTSALPS